MISLHFFKSKKSSSYILYIYPTVGELVGKGFSMARKRRVLGPTYLVHILVRPGLYFEFTLVYEVKYATSSTQLNIYI